MLFQLLSSAADTTSSSGNNNANPGQQWVIMGVLVAVIIVFMVLSRRSQKKKQQEQMDMLDAIQPGNKVKTIGGICGIVVEVCPEDNTFVLETGTEASGKSYLKFDKQAVYQTDAVAAPKAVETPVTEKTAETAEPVAETAEEQPME